LGVCLGLIAALEEGAGDVVWRAVLSSHERPNAITTDGILHDPILVVEQEEMALSPECLRSRRRIVLRCRRLDQDADQSR
jgi:hypothetical protein